MVQRLFLTMLLVFTVNRITAQDSLFLEEVHVFGINEEDYAVATRIQTVNLESRWNEGSSSLGNLLSDHSSIFLLEYGAQGQLSSINIRGLGPSRTSLLWNGMEINSFSLGQINYNILPALAFNQVQIQYGSGSALFGNGSLGGSVSVGNNLEGLTSSSVSISQTVASFGTYQTGLSLNYKDSTVKTSLKAYFQDADNDFPYELGDSIVRQSNAAFRNYGVLNDWFWKLDNRNSIEWSGWYHYDFREVQPARNDLNNDDELENENWRTSLSWNYRTASNNIETTIGYTHDRNLFNQQSEVQTARVFSAFQGEHFFRPNLSAHAGLNWNHLRTQGDNFSGRIIENRNDIFGGVRYVPIPVIEISFTARQPIVDGQLKAFSPSLSGRYTFYNLQKITMSIFGQISRSYRLPTVNDRFWNPGGNPDLNAETGRNFEAGTSLAFNVRISHWHLQSSYFYHLVDNWIIWRRGGSGEDEQGNPISFWYPDNLRSVRSQGVEINFKGTYNLSDAWRISSDLSMTYTRSINLSPLSPVDRSGGKQLPFTPLWNLNWFQQLSWRQHQLGIHYGYTGKRYVEANNELDPLPAFSLIGVSLGTSLSVVGQAIVAACRVNNLMDLDYESYENRVLPGRNYELTLQLTIK
jgi:iron complex outermembrane receptor protein